MATSKGRKSTPKKKEEKVVESPKKKVIEPKVEEPKKTVPEKEVDKVVPEPVQEELSPPPPTKDIEKIVAPSSKKDVVSKPLKELSSETIEEKLAQENILPKRELGIGSSVQLPSGKTGTVISINKKGYFEIQSDMNPRKTYLYESSSLKLL